MNVKSFLRNITILLVSSLIAVVPALAQDKKIDDALAQTHVTSDIITLNTLTGFAGFTLKVKGPNGIFFEQSYNGSEVPFIETFDLNGNMLADGLYTYELVATPQVNDDNRWAMEKVRGDASLTPELHDLLPSGMVQSGYFRVHQGEFVLPQGEETIAPRTSENLVFSKDEVKDDGGSSPIDLDDGNRDNVIADDLIVQGSACVGQDCNNGENFGFDTIRLKENNLRIRFMDTSNSGSFPTRDWQLVANDTSNGGADRFSVEDIDGGRTPFTIEGNAPSNSLYLDSSGNIGVGTASPVVELHVVDGDSPTLRLQQDQSSGFGAQTWDVAGNEANFFVRDVTNGSQLPFKIIPGADHNALYVNSNNRIGMLTASPDAALHVRRASAADPAEVHIQQTNASGSARLHIETANAGNSEMLRLTNGDAQLRMVYEQTDGDTWTHFLNSNGLAWVESGDTENTYQMRHDGGHHWGNGSTRSMTLDPSGALTVNNTSTSTAIMTLATNGDLTITGTYNPTSDKNMKQDFEEVDPLEVLATIAEMPITTWQYIHDENGSRHMGPMAQDFHAAFGLGTDNRHISTTDSDGVALAAIKGLNQIVSEKNAEIDDLKARLAKLEAMMQKLAD
jgi:hypothetical protein